MTVAGPRARGSWIPWAFVAFFATVVAANGALVVLAYHSWTGLETEDAYEKGLAFNRTLEAVRAGEALGWRVEVSFADAGPGRGRLAVLLAERDGRALTGATVAARFVRPTQAGHDKEVMLAEVGDGTYAREVELPLPGRWELRLEAEHRGRRHRSAWRLSVP